LTRTVNGKKQAWGNEIESWEDITEPTKQENGDVKKVDISALAKTALDKKDPAEAQKILE
jgi:hypothetical protein